MSKFNVDLRISELAMSNFDMAMSKKNTVTKRGWIQCQAWLTFSRYAKLMEGDVPGESSTYREDVDKMGDRF